MKPLATKANLRAETDFVASDAVVWLAEAIAHIPARRRHCATFCWVYVFRCCGQTRAEASTSPAAGEPLDPKACRSVWQELLKSVFELDPLDCPCGGRLRLRGLVRGVTLWKALAALGELAVLDGPHCFPSPLPVERAGARVG